MGWGLVDGKAGVAPADKALQTCEAAELRGGAEAVLVVQIDMSLQGIGEEGR